MSSSPASVGLARAHPLTKTQALEPSRQTWSSNGPPYPLGRWSSRSRHHNRSRSEHLRTQQALRVFRSSIYFGLIFGRRKIFLRKMPCRSVRYDSVRPHYPTEHLRNVRYELDTGTRHFGKFGTPTKNAPGTGYALRNLPWTIWYLPSAVCAGGGGV